MKRISTLEIDAAFERIWKFWPNKDFKNRAEKALEVCVRQGEDLKLIEVACKIYSNETIGQEFTSQLGNFLLQDGWKDMVEGLKDIESYGKVIDERRREAKEICETWNKKRKSFWCEILDIEERIPIVFKALKNQFFKDHWKKALDNLREIFTIKPTENDKFRNLTFSIQWFCDTSPDKHTVLKIMEGQFGHPRKEPKRVTQKIDKECIEETRKLFKEVFGYEPRPMKKPRINNNSQPLKQLTEDVITGLPQGTEKSEEGGDIGIY